MAKNPMQSILVKIRGRGGVSLHTLYAVSESSSFSALIPVFGRNDPKTIRHATLGTINRNTKQAPG